MRHKFLSDTWTVARKELLQHFKTRRLIVIGLVFAAVMLVFLVYGEYLTGQSQEHPTYEEGASRVLLLVLQFSIFFPPVLAIALTYDAVVGERVNNSMYLLISKPVRREAIYFGKLLGAWLAIACVYVAVLTVGFGIIVGLSRQAPSAGDVANLYLVIGLILLGVAAWITFALLLSTAFRTIASALITSIMMWLFVFSVVSQSGIIYYAVTAPVHDFQASTSLRITPIGHNQTLATFYGGRMRQAVVGYDVQIWDASGAPAGTRLPGGGAGDVSLILDAGSYSWLATSASNGSARNMSGNGSMLVLPDVTVSSSVFAADGDFLQNDYAFSMTGIGGNPMPDGSFVLTGSGGATENRSALASPSVTLRNLTKGWHRFAYESNNATVFQQWIFSYGTDLADSLQIILSGKLGTGQNGMPSYIKVTYALNPDNCIRSYAYILDKNAAGILTLGESVASLAVFTLTCGAIGLLLFSRKDLV